MTLTLPTLQDVQEAAQRIRPHVHKTPVMTCETMNDWSGLRLFFKCENLQKGGAFKIRGATNALLRLPEPRPVVTHSSGNHAQALALAARQLGVEAYIVMPETSPQVKKDAVKGYGGRVTECINTLQAREDTAHRIQQETGATFIHPYDHPHIIAGQGTLMLELLSQTHDDYGTQLDAIIVPVGGGGMLSGCAIAAKGLDPTIRVFAAEPLAVDDCAQSFAKKELVPQTRPHSVADGLLTSLGSYTFPVIMDKVDAVFTVTEEEIIKTTRMVWERMKLVIEPSAAVGVAVALFRKEQLASFTKANGEPIRHVGVVLCGGNVDVKKMAALF
ncbi:hypothetical protein BZG36_03976 [Bifiguratus adelaidae]|uniref:Tryptophan synthase beta chain-like PALP domain-containing protein n=1 Tax=Bifiguratus adelaidae TaxID=1938954 RepID=A0A261XXE1_9FUNG|nr:hypothetical protein BZG36_03976 [Bifiguratus adelaidae]